MKFTTTTEGEKFISDFLAGFAREQVEGSMNMEAVTASGHVVGKAKYAPMTPHHSRGAANCWLYQNTFHPRIEAWWHLIMETQIPFRLEGAMVDAAEDVGVSMMACPGDPNRWVELPVGVEMYGEADIENWPKTDEPSKERRFRYLAATISR